MGVTGLWSLVDGVGHPVNLETLHDKVLAIDLSIWINQSIKGFRDREGRVLDNAHVLGLFHRICKLLFYKIKPVFVFDGSCPQLKKHTIGRRHEQRLKAIDRSREGSIKILQNYIASQLQTSVEELQNSVSLPSLKSSLVDIPKNKSMKIYEELVDLHRMKEISDESESDSEPNIAHSYRNLQNLDSLDVSSDSFKSLPPDIRYEILTELKQKYKGWRNTDLMPQESNDFSQYQMQRLLKKRGLQQSIEETIQQLNSQPSDDVIKSWNEKDFYVDSQSNAGRLVSDENTHFIFMKKSQTIKSDTSLMAIDEPEKHVNDEDDITLNSDKHSISSCDEHPIESSLFTNSESCDENEVNKNFLSHTQEEEIKGESLDQIENKELVNSVTPQKSIEVSVESHVEELIESKVVSNSVLNKTTKIEDSIEESKESSNEFTKIKTVEVTSDTSDDDFEEVWQKSPDSIDDLITHIDVKDLEKIIDSKKTSKKEKQVNFEESALNRFETTNKDFEIIEEKSTDDKTPEEMVAEESEATQTSSNVSQSSPLKSYPTSSQSNSTYRISREEELETRREVNKQNRYANYTTDKMMNDCQELLRLFGIPFIVSPMEAEAQCAALEELGLTNGTITDDSDALLFGAQTVYKNFFTSSKYVELYKSKDIESRLGLSRSSMICIAMLCGSDYTDGVDSVGAVTATEILSEFSGDGLKPLIDYKKWWTAKQNSKDKRPENKIRAKLMKLRLPEAFPNEVIFNAYTNPTVDTSKEQFSWGMPRLDELRRYALDKFGWPYNKSDQILLPVMKKVNEKQTQMTIDNFFKVQVQPKDTAVLSKRLNKALDKLRGVESQPESSSSKSCSLGILSQKVKNQRKKRAPKADQNIGKGKRPKGRNSSNSRPQVVNLSESSESD